MNDIRTARASLMRLMEPGDATGLALIAHHGPVIAFRIAIGARPAHPFTGVTGEDLADGLSRWMPRVRQALDNTDADLLQIQSHDGGLLIPEDDLWPAALNDLEHPPIGLWYRGDLSQGIPETSECVAIVGSRDCTAYGASVTADFSSTLVQHGKTVLSGLAYGIDVAAHRAALAGSLDNSTLSTIAVVANGLDRYYPSGNAEVAEEIRTRALVLSELPLGTMPTRYRFLQRNRIIAALAGATVIVEARWRSGALSTAARAAAMGRPVGAVPGSVFSANSAGCHRLLRAGDAACVTTAQDVLELLAGPATP